MLPKRYEASALVQIDPRAKRITNIESVLSDLKTDNPTMESEVEIIKSKSIALRVIDRLRLREDPEFNPPSAVQSLLVRLGLSSAPQPQPQPAPQSRAAEQPSPPSAAAWPSNLASTGRSEEPERDVIAAIFNSRLKAYRIRNSQLIEIRFAARDPVKAARISTAIAEAYLAAQLEAKQRATAAASALLDRKLGSLRSTVADADRRVQQFKTENNMFDADGRPLDDTQLQREMEFYTAARNKTTEARAKYEQARRMVVAGESQDTVAEVMQSATIRSLFDKLSNANRHEAELSTRYGPRHPEMQKVMAEVAKAQSALASEVNKVIRSLKTELHLAIEKEREQLKRLDDMKARVAATKDKQWRLRELERDASASKSLYEAILSRKKQTQETVALQVPDARIVAQADVPMSPNGPRRSIIALGGLAAGLALGIGIALLLELASDGLRRPEDIELKLRTAHLASVPWLRRSSDGITDGLHSLRMMATAPHGPFAEAIRSMRHALDSRNAGRAPRIILVTSGQTGEGKSVIAANLALHYAMTRQRTLLIDADLRRRSLSHDLGIAGQPGLIEVLAGTAQPEPLSSMTRKPRHARLARWRHRRPAGLRDRVAVRQPSAVLLHWLRSSFDVIVVDATPLLPVVDARLLADAADQIVLVSNWRSTPVSILRRATKSLGANAIKLAGVVLNRVEPTIHAGFVGSYPSRKPLAAPHPEPLRRAA